MTSHLPELLTLPPLSHEEIYKELHPLHDVEQISSPILPHFDAYFAFPPAALSTTQFPSLNHYLADEHEELDAMFIKHEATFLPPLGNNQPALEFQYSPSMSEQKGVCLAPNCNNKLRRNYRGFCKEEHGGARKCSRIHCSRVPQGTKYCIAHGGGRPCRHSSGCQTAAQSHGFCKKHGGGTRCSIPGCSKSSQGRHLCRSHGGGKRCAMPDCNIGAQRGIYCAKHGGIRNCLVTGCRKKDRGGGFCEAHRRGKLCHHPQGCNNMIISYIDRLCKKHTRQLCCQQTQT